MRIYVLMWLDASDSQINSLCTLPLQSPWYSLLSSLSFYCFFSCTKNLFFACILCSQVVYQRGKPQKYTAKSSFQQCYGGKHHLEFANHRSRWNSKVEETHITEQCGSLANRDLCLCCMINNQLNLNCQCKPEVTG